MASETPDIAEFDRTRDAWKSSGDQSNNGDFVSAYNDYLDWGRVNLVALVGRIRELEAEVKRMTGEPK